jgi:hypothetical protein
MITLTSPFLPEANMRYLRILLGASLVLTALLFVAGPAVYLHA